MAATLAVAVPVAVDAAGDGARFGRGRLGANFESGGTEWESATTDKSYRADATDVDDVLGASAVEYSEQWTRRSQVGARTK